MMSENSPVIFRISPNYLKNLKESYTYSFKVYGFLIVLGILGAISGQILRSSDIVGSLFSLIAVIGLIVSLLSFILLLRDIQFSSIAKIDYTIQITHRGISIVQEGSSTTDPISFFPFNAVIDVKSVPVRQFIKKTFFLNIAGYRFSKIAQNINGILFSFRIDDHLKGKSQKHLFFEIPAGYSLFFVEESENFLKIIKKRRIKKKT